MSLRLITAVVAALALWPAAASAQNPSSTPGPPNSASDAVKLIYEDYRRDGKIDVCDHERADLQDALDTIEPDFDTDYPDFREALEAGVTRHDDGRCDADATRHGDRHRDRDGLPDRHRGRRHAAAARGRRLHRRRRAPAAGRRHHDASARRRHPAHGRERPVRGHADPGPQRRPAGRPGHGPARRGRGPDARVGLHIGRPEQAAPAGPVGCAGNCWRARAHLLRTPARRPGVRPHSAPAQRGRISRTGCASGDDGLNRTERAHSTAARTPCRGTISLQTQDFRSLCRTGRAHWFPSGPGASSTARKI